MENLKLYDGEYKFIEIIWKLEPISSTDLFKECEKRLGWKKSTTYTVLRKLSERGFLQNKKTIVTSLVKREQVLKYESEALLNKSFEGSLPAFIATFLKDKTISQKDAIEIKKMLEEVLK